MAESLPSKQVVAGSSPVSRSTHIKSIVVPPKTVIYDTMLSHSLNLRRAPVFLQPFVLLKNQRVGRYVISRGIEKG